MRILFICSTLNTGGAQRVLSNILMSLPSDWKLDVLLNNCEEISYPYQGRLFSLKMEKQKEMGSLSYQARVFFRRWKAVRCLKKTNTYDYVVSFMESANILNILTKTVKCKSILTSHASLSDSVRKYRSYRLIVKPLVYLLYKHADQIITVSEGVRQDYIKHFGIHPDLITTIYNGVDLQIVQKDLQDVRKRDKSQDGNPVFKICTMGRLSPSKNQGHLIRALNLVNQEYCRAELHLLGVGRLESYLRQLAIDLHIEDRVYFEGFVDPPFHLLAEYDLFVFPSGYEGFGNVIIEAAACGLPTISTDYDWGAREILAPGSELKMKTTDHIEYAEYGILVPVCSGVMHSASVPLEKEELLLAQAMEEMVQNQKLYQNYKDKCPELAQRFSMEKIGKQWIHFFEQEKANV